MVQAHCQGSFGYITGHRPARVSGVHVINSAADPWKEFDASALAQLAAARHHDPHTLLGRHDQDSTTVVTAYLPGVSAVRLADGRPLQRLTGSDFFRLIAAPASVPKHPCLHWQWPDGSQSERVDPYSFAPTLQAADLTLFANGEHVQAWQMLGAHAACLDGIDGVRFAVWAPNAERVSLVGPFCDWDGRRLPLRVLGDSGVWELFVPGLSCGTVYKFEIRNRDSGAVALKIDPYARAMELRPDTACLVTARDTHAWQDSVWMNARRARDWLHAPLSIYEVHLGSWRRDADGSFLNYRELAVQLVRYLRQMHFTHIELLPVTEHPLDDSWGYQTTGYFAPTSRHGTPDDLKFLVDCCHQAGIGVLLDWVPAHFPRDAHGLARFDGAPLYEHADPRRGEHPDWGTYIFDYERNEVRSFLLASACYWLEEFHFDGLRVDAVASMLYLDFGGRSDYLPNREGGRHNLEAVSFLQRLNTLTHARSPGTLIMAEESTDWPSVSRPVDAGGLGFSMKWNLGWMHDTLGYLRTNPLYRGYEQDHLTFLLMYAYSENFVLPFSHDEVVHLKRSLLGRMPGDRWQQLANLRLLYTWMWTQPGKKLLFMGGEFAQPWEWDFRTALPWFLTTQPEHGGVQRLVADLNTLYAQQSALHSLEFEAAGFAWIDCNDRERSILSFMRLAGEHLAVVVGNFTPVPRSAYRLGVPGAGVYAVALNSDSSFYGGSNTGNAVTTAEAVPCHGLPWSVLLDLPPLGALVLLPQAGDNAP